MRSCCIEEQLEKRVGLCDLCTLLSVLRTLLSVSHQAVKLTNIIKAPTVSWCFQGETTPMSSMVGGNVAPMRQQTSSSFPPAFHNSPWRGPRWRRPSYQAQVPWTPGFWECQGSIPAPPLAALASCFLDPQAMGVSLFPADASLRHWAVASSNRCLYPWFTLHWVQVPPRGRCGLERVTLRSCSSWWSCNPSFRWFGPRGSSPVQFPLMLKVDVLPFCPVSYSFKNLSAAWSQVCTSCSCS